MENNLKGVGFGIGGRVENNVKVEIGEINFILDGRMDVMRHIFAAASRCKILLKDIFSIHESR